jgi:hypothetical protein
VVAVGTTYSPQVIYSFPEGVICAEAVPDFCLPDGVHISPYVPTATAADASHSHTNNERRVMNALAEVKEVVFVLSGGGADGSEVSYGMCLHVNRVYRHSEKVLVQGPLCYCFISQYPFLPLHLNVLREIVRIHLSTGGGGFSVPQPAGKAPCAKGRVVTDELELEAKAIMKITDILNR